MYSIGIEEEYFVFDAKTRRAVRRLDNKFLASAKKRLGDRVMTEMLQSQIEVATPPCKTMSEARAYLTEYRLALAGAARAHKLGIAAMGTFPLAYWPEQTQTPGKRYSAIMNDLQMIGLRNMFCGMHVHVAIPDISTRINLIVRLTPYLPLLLALSTSSPFWQGNLTGLHGYRLAAYDELPRTGLPELFRTNDDYNEFVSALVHAKVIPDASYIWWAMRPSLNNPTIELRVADSCTRLEDSIAIAALFRCLVSALDRDREINAGFDRVGRAITAENKWRAQRYGISANFVDPLRRESMSADAWLDGICSHIGEEIETFQCADAIAHVRRIIAKGSSADEQINRFTKAIAGGRRRLMALKDIVDWAARETRNVQASPAA